MFDITNIPAFKSKHIGIGAESESPPFSFGFLSIPISSYNRLYPYNNGLSAPLLLR